MSDKKKTGASSSPSDPANLSAEQLAKLLTLASQKVITPQMVALDLEQGAPQNGDGTINVIRYGAWLASQLQ